MKTILWSAPGAMHNIADSAMGRDVMPLFVPDGNWHACVALAYRIGRLGKNIREKFALRYVDAVAPVLLLRPGTAECPEEPKPWLAILDSAVTTGRYAAFADAPLTLQAAGQGRVVDNHRAAAEAIVDVTRYGTVKTGDLIVPGAGMIELPLVIDTRIEAGINGECLLSVKVK